MKRKLTKIAGINASIFYVFSIIALFIICAIAFLTVLLGNALIDKGGLSGIIGSITGSLLIVISGLIIIFSVIGIIVLIVMSSMAKKIRKYSSLDIKEYKAKNPSLIAFIVINSLFAIIPIILFVTSLNLTNEGAQINVFGCLCCAVAILWICLICSFLIVDLVKNNKKYASLTQSNNGFSSEIGGNQVEKENTENNEKVEVENTSNDE